MALSTVNSQDQIRVGAQELKKLQAQAKPYLMATTQRPEFYCILPLL